MSVLENLNHPSYHRSWVEIDLLALENNIKYFLTLNKNIMPCLKADAYNHGAVKCAEAALKAGANRFAVANCLEGQKLRNAGIGVPIQVIGEILPEEIIPAIEYGLTLSVHNLEAITQIDLIARDLNKKVPVHLKIDTGMGRLGALMNDAMEIADNIQNWENIYLEGIFTHFAEADSEEYTYKQLNKFRQIYQKLIDRGIKPELVHTANTTASILYPETHFNLIRPGCGIYGFLGDNQPKTKNPEIKPILSWHTMVVNIKKYPENSYIGYNRTYKTSKNTTIATIPVGYADGYRRELSNKADVIIQGKRAPIVGIISMDYSMVDITNINDVNIGTEVTLIGKNKQEKITLEELAEKINTIPYCIVTGIGKRPEKYYKNNV